MSEYIKREDAIEKCKTIAGAGYKWLSDLPTIKVSEDCISREYVLDKLNEQYKSNRFEAHNDMANEGIGQAESITENAPSVTPTERPKGEWLTKIVKKFCAPDCWYAGTFAIEDSWNEEEGSWLEKQDGFCSECGKQDEQYAKHKYCPNCGARMDGEEQEHE